jgi:hypothetical protein
MDRTWIGSKKSLWVRCRAGEYCNGGREGVAKQYRDRKCKHEWYDRTGGSEQKGEDRQERWENTEQLRRTLAETYRQEFEIEIAILYRMIKSEQDRRGQKGMQGRKG